MSFSIQRGTNPAHWLSQSKARGEARRAFFTRADVNRIAGCEFDHIRFPIDEEQMWTPDLTRENEAFDLLGNRPYDSTQMEHDMAHPLAVSRTHGLPLYCGEFGVFDSVPPDIRYRWYHDFISVLNQHNIAWANWEYRGEFGTIDAHKNPTEVLKGLMDDNTPGN